MENTYKIFLFSQLFINIIIIVMNKVVHQYILVTFKLLARGRLSNRKLAIHQQYIH